MKSCASVPLARSAAWAMMRVNVGLIVNRKPSTTSQLDSAGRLDPTEISLYHQTTATIQEDDRAEVTSKEAEVIAREEIGHTGAEDSVAAQVRVHAHQRTTAGIALDPETEGI